MIKIRRNTKIGELTIDTWVVAKENSIGPNAIINSMKFITVEGTIIKTQMT